MLCSFNSLQLHSSRFIFIISFDRHALSQRKRFVSQQQTLRQSLSLKTLDLLKKQNPQLIKTDRHIKTGRPKDQIRNAFQTETHSPWYIQIKNPNTPFGDYLMLYLSTENLVLKKKN